MSTTERIYRPKELTQRQFLGLSAASSGLLAGCGGGGQNYGEGGGGGGGAKEFHGAYPYQLPPTGHFNTFLTTGILADPVFYHDVLEMPMAMYMWAEQKYVPYMAIEWGFEPPDVFKVTLREGAKWSDGSEFTSKDVVTTFNILRPQEQLVWNYLASGEPEDDYNLTFEMKDPSTVVERLVLRERIRANSVYGEWSKKAQELFDSGADPESKRSRTRSRSSTSSSPEQMVVSGPFKIDEDSISRIAAHHEQQTPRGTLTRWDLEKMVIYNGETPAVTPWSSPRT